MANTVEIIIKGSDLSSPAFSSAIKNVSNLGKAATSMFGVFAAGAAAGAIASTVAGLAALAARSIEAADEMGKLAQKAGLPVDQFSQLSFAAKLADVSTESLQKGLKGLSEEMVKAGRGSEAILPQLLAQADVFKGMQDGAQKTALAVQLFGRTGQDLIPLLNQGSDAIREQMHEADKLGLTISSDFAKQANEFNDNLTRLKTAGMHLGNEIGKNVVPELLRLSEWAVDWLKESNAIEASVNFITVGFAGFKQIVEDTNDALEALSKLATKIQIPFASPRGTKSAPEINPTELPGIKIIPEGGIPGISPGQDYGGAGFAPPERVAPIMPVAAGLKSEADAIAEAQRMYQQHEEYLARMDERMAAARMRGQDAVLENSARTLGMAASLAATYGKKGFAIYQALAVGEAIMSTAAGVTRAFRDYPWPYSAVVAGLVGAQGAIQIATIAAQKPPQAHGGATMIPEDATYLLKANERVLSPNQNADLINFMRGGGNQAPIELHLDGQKIATWFFDSSRNGNAAIHPRAIREQL